MMISIIGLWLRIFMIYLFVVDTDGLLDGAHWATRYVCSQD